MTLIDHTICAPKLNIEFVYDGKSTPIARVPYSETNRGNPGNSASEWYVDLEKSIDGDLYHIKENNKGEWELTLLQHTEELEKTRPVITENYKNEVIYYTYNQDGYLISYEFFKDDVLKNYIQIHRNSKNFVIKQSYMYQGNTAQTISNFTPLTKAYVLELAVCDENQNYFYYIKKQEKLLHEYKLILFDELYNSVYTSAISVISSEAERIKTCNQLKALIKYYKDREELKANNESGD